ncbi:hypothetical protein pdam_00015407 [Pocillopora damicornis]|uniref:Endonuclease/exonuclease/phosphatase domain-containing protein n=1 Tax=Pocillopora damicornis TaxID=46731 RepID=A0A3M6TDP6_POCDA|nr:hypothetical protein pdam_00015407 [Pocillopora damicornis]
MVTDDEILMPGYNCVRRDRQRKADGGVAIYCRDSVVPGDFNIDFSVGRRNANSSQKRLLKEITELHDLKQVIESPTFVTEHSEFLIDLCFTKKITESDVIDPGLSDHSLVYCVMKSGRYRAPPKTIQFRSYKNYNRDPFVSELRQVAESHAPIRTSRVRGFSIPWLNSHVTDLMNKCNNHLKKAKGNKSSIHWRLYRDLRNKVSHSIKKAKSDYYTNLIIDSSKSSAKDFWRAFKQTLPSSKTSSRITNLLADGALLTSAQSIASTFNTYFVNVGKFLVEKIVPEPSSRLSKVGSILISADDIPLDNVDS